MARRKSKNLRRKSAIRIRVKHPGSLEQYGYSLHEKPATRRIALTKALKHFSYAEIMKKVNLLYVYNKRVRPHLAEIASADKEWLKSNPLLENFGKKSKRKSARKPKRKSVRKSVRKPKRKSVRRR